MEPPKTPRPVLLHGVTGSGKTEIYMQAVRQTIENGGQCLILVPEISMTPQTVRRFMARFPPNKVGIYHSKLSDGERYDTWRRAQQSDLQIIIGSRSALFLPLPELKLIVIDECDNDSYDETERLPLYHAVTTALALTEINQARLLMGSATPSIVQSYTARRGNWLKVDLPDRVLAHRHVLQQQANLLNFSLPEEDQGEQTLSFSLPPVEIIDMRKELFQGNTSVLSRSLEKALDRVLRQNQQAILFLNRRGQATYVFVVIAAPACDARTMISPLSGMAPALVCFATFAATPAKCPKPAQVAAASRSASLVLVQPGLKKWSNPPSLKHASCAGTPTPPVGRMIMK